MFYFSLDAFKIIKFKEKILVLYFLFKKTRNNNITASLISILFKRGTFKLYGFFVWNNKYKKR